MIRLGITGYGNLGKALERIANASEDIQLVGIFSRRNNVVSPFGTPIYLYSEKETMTDKIDIMAICSGSANDVPVQGRELCKLFNTVDSFDTHALIPDYYKDVDNYARENNHISLISAGWDPGLFSYMRLLFSSVIGEGETNTFWGKGVSQGHSDAIRRIAGVIDAKQYTIPKEDALNKARSGENCNFTPRDKHLRECFVVAEEDADKERIEREIKTLPHYFDEYDTIVHFIDKDTFIKEHSGMAHGGSVIRAGEVSGTKDSMEFSIKLQSNPDFTASCMLAYIRGAYKMREEGQIGCKTVFDIPVSYMTNMEREDFIKKML